MTEMVIRAERPIWQDGVRLHVGERDRSGKLFVCQPPALTEIAEGHMWPEPMLTLRVQEAQRLMDELWGCGLRPSEGTGSAGSLAATERHLKDMQTIAMSLLQTHGVTKA